MKLNQIQSRVINHKGNALVFASAGTGKTFTLSTKIEMMINNCSYNPNEILCLTFTNRGCNEMISKIKSKLKEKINKITIKTFHAFCYDLIKQYKIHKKEEIEEYVIYDEEDVKNICLSLSDEYELSASIIGEFINFAKQEIISKGLFNNSISASLKEVVSLVYKEKDKLNNHIKKTHYKFNNDFTKIVDINKALTILIKYQKQLYESHAYDFNDLEYYANVSLNNENFLEKVQNLYKVIFVDEAQDTSFVEYKMIKKIGIKSRMYLCGDFFQTIYEWRGSEPDLIIDDYKKTFNPEIFVFNVNYRSTQVLANASFGVLKNMFNSLVEKTYDCHYISNNQLSGDKIKFFSCNNHFDEARIIDKLVKINEEENLTVLVRTNRYAIELSKQLRNLNPNKYFLVQEYQYYRRNEVKEIMAFLRLILNPYDSVSFEKIALKYVKGFGEKRLSKIIDNEAYKSGLRVSDLLDVKTHEGNGDQYKLLLDKLNSNEIVIFDTETTGLKFDEDEIIQIGAIKLNSKFEIINKLNVLVKANKSVGDSYHIHKISDNDLKAKGIDKKVALEKLMKFIGNSVIVGHNVSFDIKMLNSELSKANMSLCTSSFYDTLTISKRYIKKTVNFKLETLCNYLNLEHISSHDALDDVIATCYLLKYLITNYIIPTSEERTRNIKEYLLVFKKIANKIQEFREDIYKLSFSQFIDKIIGDLNIEKIYKNSNDALFNINHFKELSKIVIDENLDTYNSLRSIVNIASLTSSDLDAIYKEKKLIPIITVHQSKGCEFNDVYVAGVYDNMFPSYISKITNTLEEEKRLFYVAITRAKNRMYITIPTYDLKGNKTKKSPYLDYFDKQYIEVIED